MIPLLIILYAFFMICTFIYHRRMIKEDNESIKAVDDAYNKAVNATILRPEHIPAFDTQEEDDKDLEVQYSERPFFEEFKSSN